jgi:hypothetical protein
MGTEDRRRGKLLPDPVTPPDTVCYKITIPNAAQYKAALVGSLGHLTEWYTWDHELDGQVDPKCEEAAELFSRALLEATFSDDCEADMSCDDIADCIETSESVADAIAALVAENQALQQQINNYNNYGVPMTNAQASEPLAGAIDCEPDSLFGSVTAIVNQLNTNNVDFLEQFEIESNTVERARDLFAAIPVFETLPFDDALNYIETLMGEIKENYDAAVTTALIDEYRCDLFCLARDRDDCAISFDILISYFEDRLGASFEPETIFVSFVEFFTTGSWTGTQIVDVMMLGQLAIWRTASDFMGISIRTLQMVGVLGSDNLDPDWEILCTDCSNLWEKCWDLETETLPFTFIIGSYSSGVGIEDAFLQAGNGYRGIVMSKAMGVSTTIKEVSYTFEYEAGTLDSTGDKTSYFAVESVPLIDVTSPTIPASPQEWTGTQAGDDLFIQILCGVKSGTGDPLGSVTLKTLCISGNGPEPTW